MSGMSMTAETAFRLVDDLRQEAERHSQREALLLGTLLMGSAAPPGARLLGVPVKVTVEWPEGRPFGWSEEQLREYGEKIFTQAGGRLDR